MLLRSAPCASAPRRCRGFTLQELLVALAIAVITTTLVVPAFGRLASGSRITAALNSLATAVAAARSSAILYGVRATLCPSGDGSACLATSDWGAGWILFIDDNRDRNRDAGERILLTRSAMGDTVQVSANRKRITYESDGTALGGSNGTYVFCDAGDQSPPRALIISNPGRARLATTRADGSPLSCS